MSESVKKETINAVEYNFRAIEQKWQQQWIESDAYRVSNQTDKPKYYVLDMFPYPSGAGLHVGHPLGYIASDIVARYKRLKGFNVLHPMGYDAFGLPAEQYAIEHGVHPAVSTAKNIATFRSQLDKIGFSFDWSREVNTSNPGYYKWTQWIFLQLFKSWYNRKTARTEPIDGLINIFEAEGNFNYPIPNSQFQIPDYPHVTFTSDAWYSFTEKQKQAILMEYRIAYCGYGEVNWCEALGTVLANDEVVNGVSERGGYPVVKKKLRQWYLRITEYADRLLEGLQRVDFSDAMKEMQTNWIGKSSGAEIDFRLTPGPSPAEPEREDGSVVAESYPKYMVRDRVQFENARRNRKNSTAAELALWEQIRDQKLGVKFRRQHPVDGFIADFACLHKGLIIEVDGGYHNTEEQKQFDQHRTEILQQKGFTILRFSNDEVRENVYNVRERINDFLSQQSTNLGEPQAPYATTKDSQTIGDPTPLSIFDGEGLGVRCYTTRPDTIFGVDFLVLAPEHELVERITTAEQKAAVEEYITYVKSRSERERMAEKKISGVFTGAYAVNPFDGRQIPVWISEYVLAGYGTGAIMAVPSGDERDHKFARYFNIPITNIIGDAYNGEEANPTKDAVLSNSGFLDGMVMRDAIDVVIDKLEEMGIGKRKVNYKMRDAAFSRQRYWGEPFPIKWKNGIAYPLDESELPLELPYVESYGAGPEGEGPLANIPEWTSQDLETNTMPGYAGSSWYFLRYMDPHNDQTFCDKAISTYWSQVDLYVGGTEHAVGHLLYSRMWTKCLYDLGLITFDEPFKKLLNQGMIQGNSRFIYRVNGKGVENLLWEILSTEFGDYEFQTSPSSKIDFVSHKKQIAIEVTNVRGIDSNERKKYVSEETTEYNFSILSNEEILGKYISGDLVPFLKRILSDNISYTSASEKSGPFFVSFDKTQLFGNDGVDVLHVDVNIVNGIALDIDAFKKSKPEYVNVQFILSANGEYQCGVEVEKMSKSKFNTVNPDLIVERFGADTFRMYEMFLGPVEMSKPWDTKGIEGVHRFLKKLWRLFFDETKGKLVTDEKAAPEELKVLHRTIKKIEEDTERFSFNTCVSAFMVCVNDLTDLKCHKREVLEPLLVLLTPYAPHISEELWHQLGNTTSVLDASYPKFDNQYLVETTKEYPVSINGKMRTTMVLDLAASQEQAQEMVLQNPVVQKWTEGKPLKKFIFVKGKMINLVV